jgi:hypothetical protein
VESVNGQRSTLAITSRALLAYQHGSGLSPYLAANSAPRRLFEPRQPTSSLAQFGENLCVKIGSDPEPCSANQVIENRPDSFNQSSSFRLGQYAEQADYAQAERSRGPAATSLIYPEQIRSPLQGQHNRLGFARVKLGAQLPHAGLVLRGGNNQPRAAAQVDQRRRTIGARQLPTHRWRD